MFGYGGGFRALYAEPRSAHENVLVSDGVLTVNRQEPSDADDAASTDTRKKRKLDLHADATSDDDEDDDVAGARSIYEYPHFTRSVSYECVKCDESSWICA